jgi:hypothetical protein
MARVAELERSRARDEDSRSEQWQAITAIKEAIAGFRATTTEQHRENREDIAEIRDSANRCRRDVQALREDLGSRREADLKQRAKDRRALLLAGIPLLCALIGAAAILLSQGIHP